MCSFLYPWFNALQLYINKIQQDATVCRYLFTAKSLYMFRVSIIPINLPPTWPKATLEEGCAQVLRPVPEAAATVYCTPDDGRDGRPKRVE